MFSLYVVPDVHGDLNAFLIPLQEFIKNFKNNHYLIYLGDYIDRGRYGLTILKIIKYIKDSDNIYKNNIIFLLGNHDAYAKYTSQKDDITHTQEINDMLISMGATYEPDDININSKYFDILIKVPFKLSFLTFSHDDLYINRVPIEINSINDILFKYNTFEQHFITLSEYDEIGRGISIHAHTHGGNIKKIQRQLHRIYDLNNVNESIDLDVNQSYIYNDGSTNSLFVILTNETFEIHNCYNNKETNNKTYNKIIYKGNERKMHYYVGDYETKNRPGFIISNCLKIDNPILKTITETDNNKLYKDMTFFNKTCTYDRRPYLISSENPNYSDFIENADENNIYRLFNDYYEDNIIKGISEETFIANRKCLYDDNKNINNKNKDFIDYSILLLIIVLVVSIIIDSIISNICFNEFKQVSYQVSSMS